MVKVRSTKLTHQQRHALTSITTGFFAAILLATLIFLVVFVFARGSSFFWPMVVYKVVYSSDVSDNSIIRYELSPLDQTELEENVLSRINAQFKSETLATPLVSIELAKDVHQILLENGKNVLGRFQRLHTPTEQYESLDTLMDVQQRVSLLRNSLAEIQNDHLARIHRLIAQYDRDQVAIDAPAREKVAQEFQVWQTRADAIEQLLLEYHLVFKDASEQYFTVYASELDHMLIPNEMSFADKLWYMLVRISQFLSDPPKQAATSGGVFPALFGTVLMVLIMSILVAPLGIITALYLHEYAPDNAFTSFLRISISNMAGVPSVVYGVFGLGFFVYVVGGSIDQLFYADALPTPTFGTPGLFWASLTMALLTLPVVIVSTEEGLRRVPSGLRSGAYALGATKFETITKTVIPVASPGMITGLILAIARAAGEVAPLILVGAVKYAPTLPVDGEFPFLHLERQFMHLGVFIYDGAFLNQTNTQGSAMMFASCLLLLMIVFVLNLFAIIVRNRLRRRYVL